MTTTIISQSLTSFDINTTKSHEAYLNYHPHTITQHFDSPYHYETSLSNYEASLQFKNNTQNLLSYFSINFHKTKQDIKVSYKKFTYHEHQAQFNRHKLLNINT